jgi:hypothetical protein
MRPDCFTWNVEDMMKEWSVKLKNEHGVEFAYYCDSDTESGAVAQALAEYSNCEVVFTRDLGKLEPGSYYHRFI